MKTELIPRETELMPKDWKEVESTPKLPPTPVFDEQIESYVAETAGFVCNNEMDFERAKVLGTRGTNLKNNILSGYRPLKQAIDAYKQPILDKEKADLAKVTAAQTVVDDPAVTWKSEQDRLAQVEADRKREEERQRREDEKAKEVKVLEEWGDTEGAKEVAQAPTPPPRPVTASSGFTYRRGVRTKPKLKAHVTVPDAVKPKYTSPDLVKINFAVANFAAWNKKPTPEQIKALEEEIGGVKIDWE